MLTISCVIDLISNIVRWVYSVIMILFSSMFIDMLIFIQPTYYPSYEVLVDLLSPYYLTPIGAIFN